MFVLVATPVTIILVSIALGSMYLRHRQHKQFKNSVATLLASHETFRQSLDGFDGKLTSSSKVQPQETSQGQARGPICVVFAEEPAIALLQGFLLEDTCRIDQHHHRLWVEYPDVDEESFHDRGLKGLLLKEYDVDRDYRIKPRDINSSIEDTYWEPHEEAIHDYA